MVDHFWKYVGDIAARNNHLVVFTAQNFYHQALVSCLVVFGIFEAQRKGLEVITRELSPERGNQRAVQPAGKIAPDWHIGAQYAQGRGAFERASHLFNRVLKRSVKLVARIAMHRIARCPVGVVAHASVVIGAHMAGLQFSHAVEYTLRRNDGPESESLGDADCIKGARDGGVGRENSFGFAGKIKVTSVLANMQGANPHPVTGKYQTLGYRVPDCHCPLTIQSPECGITPSAVSMDDHFGIAAGAKAVAECDQLFAQLHIIEYLAVEYDPGPVVFVRHGLLSGCEINDGQARVREAGMIVAIHTKLIRATMIERAGHANQRFVARRGYGGTESDNSGDATHRPLNFGNKVD